MKSRQGDNVEFVLWTGDGLSHSAYPMSEEKRLEIMRNITDLLGRTFSSQFVFPVLGHQDGTTMNFPHMGELWRHWLPSEALQTFEKGGYYSIEQTKSRLRIIALNTNFMRHDPRHSQSHLAAVRQRQHHSDSGEHRNDFYYHHSSNLHRGNQRQHHSHSSSGGGGDWSSVASFGHGYNSHHRGAVMQPDVAHVSALSEYENQDTEKQWIWLEEVLSKSKDNKETVYIIGHVPPGSDERHFGNQQNGHTTYTESNNRRYLELVRKYSSIIQGQFFGHLHSDSFRIIYDDKGKPVSWVMISPSVTPLKANIGSNNPAMRLYKFDTDSGQVLDYTQFYMDLQLANTLGEPNWQPEYNLTHYYGLNDISAISLHNFVDRFTGSEASWFAKYYRANSVRYPTGACDGDCLLHHYCAITRVDYKEFRQCLDKERNALSSDALAVATPSLMLATMCPFLALLLTVMATCRMLSRLLQPNNITSGNLLMLQYATKQTTTTETMLQVLKQLSYKILDAAFIGTYNGITCAGQQTLRNGHQSCSNNNCHQRVLNITIKDSRKQQIRGNNSNNNKSSDNNSKSNNVAAANIMLRNATLNTNATAAIAACDRSEKPVDINSCWMQNNNASSGLRRPLHAFMAATCKPFQALDYVARACCKQFRLSAQ